MRYYQGLLSHSVLAVRLTSATSFWIKAQYLLFGQAKQHHFPSFDNSVPLPENRDLLLNQCTPLGGLQSNIRNGSSYALLNTEFRLPLFMYLLGKDKGIYAAKLPANCLFDAGLAWYGAGPIALKTPQFCRVKMCWLSWIFSISMAPL
ncbi:MAG: hypothetical protein IPJ54_10270 [Saprospiraceae bacterium]|nr:hypothetical protein [Saprospiraceae bacterium]